MLLALPGVLVLGAGAHFGCAAMARDEMIDAVLTAPGTTPDDQPGEGSFGPSDVSRVPRADVCAVHDGVWPQLLLRSE